MSSLYKFVHRPEAVRNLLSGHVKFTPVSELNDPSELLPDMNHAHVKTSLERIRSDGYSEADMIHLGNAGRLMHTLAPHQPVIEVPTTKERATQIAQSEFYDLTDVLEQKLLATAREMASNVGIFCLSSRFDSLPMWAHYAGNAAGFVVMFEGLDEVFPGDGTGILDNPQPVTYERELHGVTFEPNSHESMFFSKFRDWSYEKEVRVVLPLFKCRTHRTGDRVLHLYEIPRSCVRRVIIGWHADPESINTVETHIREIGGQVELVRARIDRGRVVLAPHGCDA